MAALRVFATVLLSLFFCVPALGAFKVKSLETRFLSYLHADHIADKNALAEGKLSIEGRRNVAPNVEAVLDAEVWGDMRSLSSGIVNQIHDRAARRPNLNASEAYLHFRFDRCDLRLGKQKISWGQADGLNPTDVFGAFDYADLLDPRRLGQVGLRAFLYPASPEDDEIELVVLPFYSPSRSGRINTRWRPLMEDGTTAVPVDVRFPKNTISNTGYGIRVARRMGEWDLSAGYSRVIDDVAGGERIQAPLIRPLFLKKRTAGIDGSRTLDESRWEVHFEAAYTSTPSGFDDDYLQTVLGGRRTFVDAYREVDLNLTMEWAAEHIYSRRRNPAVIAQNLVQRHSPGSILIKTEWELTEFLAWTCEGAYTFRGRDAYIVSNVLAWRVTDLLELRAGVDVLSGRGSRTTQAAYEENDRWRIEATIYFR